MSDETPKDARSGINPENIQEVLDAGASAKQATLGGQQQYQTPVEFARFFNGLLPHFPNSGAFDPQCAGGNTIKEGMPYWVKKFGFEIDNRYRDKGDGVNRLIGNCVKLWEIMDDVFPELKMECINANPPFGIQWALPDGSKADSTEYTWRKIMQRAHEHGYGWFISNHKTIERLGIDKHPSVYLYQKFPMGVWDNCEVEIGVVHWDNHPKRFGPPMTLEYKTLDLTEHSEQIAKVKGYYAKAYQYSSPHHIERDAPDNYVMPDAWGTIDDILKEERANRPPFNIYLDKRGMLKTYLSTRFQVKRKLSRDQILRVAQCNDEHPLTLTTDRESRKLLADLVDCGVYTIEPAAEKAIRDALAEVNRLAAPIMPVTDFETVAYADEEDHLVCREDFFDDHPGFAPPGPLRKAGKRIFTEGKAYEISTASYSFVEQFTRNKPHFHQDEDDPEGGEMTTVVHQCALTGVDRFIQIQDDHGGYHRFMDKPTKDSLHEHEEALLWKIFHKPNIKTVAESHPDLVEKNKLTLSTCEMLADFNFYPGQLGYLARVAVKDYGIIAAVTGAGKSLMAISLIQVKGPRRALIIAPQGTMRTSQVEEDDDDDEQEEKASQWIEELRRFGPGLPVFQLFSPQDYQNILNANGGKLPEGAVYVSYYEAMFSNGGRESAADSWDDERLQREMQLILGRDDITLPESPPFVTFNPKKSWCSTIGKEKDGIRCIIKPCMATLISDQFDMVCLDEGHRCTNLDANVTQMLIRMQPKYRFVFTATPIPNIVANLFPLMGWVCVPEWYRDGRRNAAWPYARKELGRFTETFQAYERDFTQEEIDAEEDRKHKRYRNRKKCIKTSPVISSPARLLKILKPNMAYISKPMCNPDYKEAKLIDVRVPLGEEQAELYVYFTNRGNIISRNPLVRARKQISYLRGICADPAGFNPPPPQNAMPGPKVNSNFNPKTVAILEIARDIINRGDQVVIVCSRKGQTNTLHMLLRDAGVLVSRIDSTIPAEQHSHQSNLFKSFKTQVHLMGIKCAVAHSYSECPWMIVGSLEYSWGSLDQARGRIDRVNSKYDRTIYCVLHKDTIEEVMFDVVATKQDSATICLQGKRVPRTYKPIDMSEVLAMALDKAHSLDSQNEAECQEQWPKLRATFNLDKFLLKH